MQSTLSLSVMLVLAGGLGASSLLAQPTPGGGGAGRGSPLNRMYNPQTVETIRGEVVQVEKVTPPQGQGVGVHLQVQTEKETLPVHLGPAWFLDHQEVQIQPKDQVQITGSRVTLEGKPALIAAEVKDGSAVLKLRDAQGIPVWAGWRRGAGAAPAPGGMMRGPGGMDTNRMARRKEMMQEHQKMMAEMKAMDADLDQKLAQMNQTQGNAKMDAMAAVINDLAKERQMMHQRMTEMHQRMMSRMQSMPGGMGGSEPEADGSRSGSDSAPSTE